MVFNSLLYCSFVVLMSFLPGRIRSSCQISIHDAPSFSASCRVAEKLSINLGVLVNLSFRVTE